MCDTSRPALLDSHPSVFLLLTCVAPAACNNTLPSCPCITSLSFFLPTQMSGSSPYTAASFHPDGLLLVTGTADAKAQIWEMRQQKAVTGFEAGGNL